MRVPPPTDRLRFRPYSETDLHFVEQLFADPHARRFYPDMTTADDARRWIAWNESSYRDHGFGLWIVETLTTGTPVGDCGLTMQQVGSESLPEVGYHLVEAARGCGYAIEAARACVAFALDTIGFTTVCSIVDPDNLASIRVASAVHEDRTMFTNQAGHERALFTTAVSPGPSAGRVETPR